MTPTTKKKTPWPELEAMSDDGRRQRSDRSRRRIIVAMFELLREGEMSPSAVQVAERANVGLRTVFRHFEDMESIFEEMTDELKSVLMPRLTAPFEATTPRGKLLELTERLTDLYEQAFPMQVALVIRRFQSEFLQKQYKSEVSLLRSVLKSILPQNIIADRTRFAAIEVNLTFATWRRLREDQNLSATNAKKTLLLILEALTDGLD